MQFFYMIVSMVKGLFFFFVLSVLVSCSFWRKVSPPIQTVHFKEDNKYQNAAEKSFQKAFSNYLSKEYNEALSEFHDFQKKYAASPRFHESIYYEARSFEKLKKYVQATQRYRDLSTMGKVHPDLTARIMYRLSFCYEGKGENEKAIASLKGAEAFSRRLPERIIKAEVPARLAAAYLRLGNKKLSKEYFKKAERGIQFLRQKNGFKKLPIWYVQTLYFMGDLKVEPKSVDQFESSISSLKKSQVYLLQAVEAYDEIWSERAVQNLIDTYVNFWNYIQSYQPNFSQDMALLKREKQKKQWEMSYSLLHALEALKLSKAPVEKESSEVQRVFKFTQSLEEEVQKLLDQPEAGRGLTPEALEREGLRRKGRILVLNPEMQKNRATTPEFLDTTDPNL